MKTNKRKAIKQNKMHFTVFTVMFLLIVTFSTKASANQMILRLEAKGNNMQNETVVYFDSTGSFDYNYLYDAPSLGTGEGYLNIVTTFNGMDYQIKELPVLVQNISVPIKITTGTTGLYEIYANDIQNLPSGAYVILHDNYTNTDQDLRTGSYYCTINDTENSGARFILNITTSVLTTIKGNYINPSCALSSDGYIIATTTEDGVYNYFWKDSLNNVIKISSNKNGPDTLKNLNSGMYSVDINKVGTANNGTLFFTLNGIFSPRAFFGSNALTINDSAQVVFINYSTNSNTFWWDFGDGMGCSDTNVLHSYADVGTYTVALSAYSSTCNESVTYAREITALEPTTGIKQITAIKNKVYIARDENGYFVEFNYINSINGTISITTISGEQIMEDIKVTGVTTRKIYVGQIDANNQILIISVATSTGETSYGKFLTGK